jgi:hypothetical protein
VCAVGTDSSVPNAKQPTRLLSFEICLGHTERDLTAARATEGNQEGGTLADTIFICSLNMLSLGGRFKYDDGKAKIDPHNLLRF